MKTHHLNQISSINKPLLDVFAFFCNAENLARLTPPSVNFKILTPLPISIKQGALIDYRIKINGIIFNWQTEINIWEPPFRFVDIQKKGPYKLWRHEHLFEEKNGKTQMTDNVEFQSPGWILEPIINGLFVEKKVNEIFTYRNKQIGLWELE